MGKIHCNVSSNSHTTIIANIYLFSFPMLHQWRVRKEAMMGLASIYKKYSLQGEGGREASKQISWIKDKLLHIYYQNSIDDRFVCMCSWLLYLTRRNVKTPSLISMMLLENLGASDGAFKSIPFSAD